MMSAAHQVRLEAGARNERTLEAVTCMRLLGVIDSYYCGLSVTVTNSLTAFLASVAAFSL